MMELLVCCPRSSLPSLSTPPPAPSPAVLEELPTGYAVDVGAGVLDDDGDGDEVVGVLPPLVSAVVVDSFPSPAVLEEELTTGYRVNVRASVLEDDLVFGGFAFPPVSLGPAGDCPCKD